MQEALSICEDAYIRTQGHLIYALPPSTSVLWLAALNREYESACSVFRGDTIEFTGPCRFKLRPSGRNSNVFIVALDVELPHHVPRLSRIEIDVSPELYGQRQATIF